MISFRHFSAAPCQITTTACDDDETHPTLDSIRSSLIRQRDTIVFGLIERAKYPTNTPLYNNTSSRFPGTLFEYFVKKKRSSSIQEKLLPLLAKKGDDENYAVTASSDLQLLQALSRRIHCGQIVAEVKFRDNPDKYKEAIRGQDRDALMKLVTFEAVEEKVKKRVAKKARVFGRQVTLDHTDNATETYKKSRTQWLMEEQCRSGQWSVEVDSRQVAEAIRLVAVVRWRSNAGRGWRWHAAAQLVGTSEVGVGSPNFVRRSQQPAARRGAKGI
nr:chorismate mutase 2 isoform X2 [Ipomoea batatas]